MAFADKYAARAADVFDEVHDKAPTIEVRHYARQAKVSAGWGAVTIATEINPVAAMLDLVTMARLKRKSFEEHGARLLPPELARQVQAMHERSEEEAWVLARRFLSEQQEAQLRGVIDDWYESNSEVRAVAHLKLLDFASFRRESAVSSRNAPASVLALLYLDPLARMDPVQRELNESRLFAERTLFFAKRVPLLGFWQLQLAAVDLLMTPEIRDLLASTATISKSTARFATSAEQFIEACKRFTDACERFTAVWEKMPGDTQRIVATALEDFQTVVSAERAAAIEQSAAAIDAQRKALINDVDALEDGARGVIADVNRALVQAEATAAAVSTSARDTVESAHLSLRDVIDHAYRRMLILLVVMLIGIPAAMIVYRYTSTKMFGAAGGGSRGRAG
jgi:hypothetical protein